jgi:hypothetical protein
MVVMMPTRWRTVMVMVMVMVSLRDFHLACGRVRQTGVVCSKRGNGIRNGCEEILIVDCPR